MLTSYKVKFDGTAYPKYYKSTTVRNMVMWSRFDKPHDTIYMRYTNKTENGYFRSLKMLQSRLLVVMFDIDY